MGCRIARPEWRKPDLVFSDPHTRLTHHVIVRVGDDYVVFRFHAEEPIIGGVAVLDGEAVRELLKTCLKTGDAGVGSYESRREELDLKQLVREAARDEGVDASGSPGEVLDRLVRHCVSGRPVFKPLVPKSEP